MSYDRYVTGRIRLAIFKSGLAGRSEKSEGSILNKNRNDLTLQLAMEDEIWPLYEQLSIFFLFIGHILAYIEICHN